MACWSRAVGRTRVEPPETELNPRGMGDRQASWLTNSWRPKAALFAASESVRSFPACEARQVVRGDVSHLGSSKAGVVPVLPDGGLWDRGARG